MDFKSSIIGYKRSVVDDYIRKLQQEKSIQKVRLKEMEERLKQLQNEKETISHQMLEMKTQETLISESIVKAVSLSQQITDDAKIRAEKMIQDANHKIANHYRSYESNRTRLEMIQNDLIQKVNDLRDQFDQLSAKEMTRDYDHKLKTTDQFENYTDNDVFNDKHIFLADNLKQSFEAVSEEKVSSGNPKTKVVFPKLGSSATKESFVYRDDSSPSDVPTVNF